MYYSNKLIYYYSTFVGLKSTDQFGFGFTAWSCQVNSNKVLCFVSLCGRERFGCEMTTGWNAMTEWLHGRAHNVMVWNPVISTQLLKRD